MGISRITNIGALRAAIAHEGYNVILIMDAADWGSNCMYARIVALAREHPLIHFYVVSIAANNSAESGDFTLKGIGNIVGSLNYVPTICAYRNGAPLTRVIGTDYTRLTAMIREWIFRLTRQ